MVTIFAVFNSKKEFKMITDEVYQAFNDDSVNLNDLLIKLESQSATKNQTVPLFKVDFFKNVTSIKELFEVLDYCWNFYDHDMLAFLINIAKCEKASKIYDQFVDSLDPSSSDLINHCSDKEISGYKTLQITVEKNVCTNKMMSKIKKMIVEHCELEKYAIVFRGGVKKGSIVIEFLGSDLVMIHTENCMHKLTTQCQVKLRNEAVVRIKCNDFIVEPKFDLDTRKVCKLFSLYMY